MGSGGCGHQNSQFLPIAGLMETQCPSHHIEYQICKDPKLPKKKQTCLFASNPILAFASVAGNLQVLIHCHPPGSMQDLGHASVGVKFQAL